MNKAYKVQLKPNNKQKTALNAVLVLPDGRTTGHYLDSKTITSQAVSLYQIVTYVARLLSSRKPMIFNGSINIQLIL
jgi:hypothetical protein